MPLNPYQGLKRERWIQSRCPGSGATMPLNPYQGLKLDALNALISDLPCRDNATESLSGIETWLILSTAKSIRLYRHVATMPLNPYQGLKRLFHLSW
jgi:hypothetical protein